MEVLTAVFVGGLVFLVLAIFLAALAITKAAPLAASSVAPAPAAHGNKAEQAPVPQPDSSR